MRNELPSGTVTLLFTDVEGSTRLLHELGAETYAEVLAEHRRVLRAAFAERGGVEVDTEGDAFFYAFPSAAEAVAAAGEGQESLSSGAIRVRIGVHTGRPHVDSEGYVGEDVHLAARIAAAGHGGQVLLSQATRNLVEIGLTDLGEHRLKDFSEPVWIFQLGNERFPPLKTISNTNLPRPPSSFVGREREISEIVEAVCGGARLVTLSGPGGSGKTRLAIEAAGELVARFKNGVFWINLADLRDPSFVAETVAQEVGAKDELAEHIGERELLLLLDNFEQVVEAAPELASLLESCPNLCLLVTSREVLRVRGEVEYPVAPLAQSDAVELFCTRSRREPDDDIAELCRRLDNLPLAVELAAARTTILAPGQILERLAERLDLLRGGRDADARQETLRATIEWSHDLLTATEQRLFARLSVFAGGCTLTAAETICGAELDSLQSLVDKSLVRYAEERFWMLETIHQFARERLAASRAHETVAGRHASFYCDLAASAETTIKRGAAADREAAMRRIAREIPNVRAAYAELLGVGDAVGALRLATGISPTLESLASIDEAYALVVTALMQADHAPAPLRYRARYELAALDNVRGNYGDSFASAADVSRYARSSGDSELLFNSLVIAGIAATCRNDFREAHALFDEALGVAHSRGDDQSEAEIHVNLADLALAKGDYEEAEAIAERALSQFEAIGYGRDGVALVNLTQARIGRGDTAGAAETLIEALQVSRRLGRREWIAAGIGLAGTIAAKDESFQRAAQLLAAGEALRTELGIVLTATEARLHDEAVRLTEARTQRAAVTTAAAQETVLAENDAFEAALEYLGELRIRSGGKPSSAEPWAV